ncbi:serine/threonine protein kinase [Candidatus Thiothrix anitrata]|uniref:Serine/threonine protein kinase n=1 Tax=Candidatus Thiothrix anitrata TaxID=2823902 RepID=A0ABX7X3P6_9GAMM|nr:serine/threonine-protein kinase [Candidatus Thiothrix anitrata]QTR50221.1 serine/threonine protein kinase [Candidatus Thiothrix anitrata]
MLDDAQEVSLTDGGVADEYTSSMECGLQCRLQQFPISIAGWQLLEVLHSSDNAIIFLAQNAQGQQAAIKRFKFDVQAVAASRVMRFLRDCRTLGLLKRAGLVHLWDAGVSHRAIYLVMEYVHGDTLKNYLASVSLPALGQRLCWFGELLGILSRVHAAGLLHRDLKTSNILVRHDQSLVLLDFGMETQLLVEAGFLGENEIYGTPYYISPERLLGDPADVRTDLYALGVIFYELLTGQKPYEGRSLAELLKKQALAPIPQLSPEVAHYQPLLNGLLAKFPENRLPSVAAVVCLLHQLHGGNPCDGVQV